MKLEDLLKLCPGESCNSLEATAAFHACVHGTSAALASSCSEEEQREYLDNAKKIADEFAHTYHGRPMGELIMALITIIHVVADDYRQDWEFPNKSAVVQ